MSSVVSPLLRIHMFTVRRSCSGAVVVVCWVVVVAWWCGGALF